MSLLAYKYQKHTLKCQVAEVRFVIFPVGLPDGNFQKQVQVEDSEQAVVGIGYSTGLAHEPPRSESRGSQPGLETSPSAAPTLPQFGDAPVCRPDTFKALPEPRTAEYSAIVAPATSDKPPTSLNKHDLLVFPDEHSIVDDPFLRRTPYIVNTKYLVLICTDCRHCVNPARSSRHIRKHHSHCKIGSHFDAQVIDKFPGLLNEEIQPPEAIEPVFGLTISEETFTVCTRCRRGYRNVSTWRHHNCRRLHVDLEGRPEYFDSHVQSFFKGRKVCHFPVKLSGSGLDAAHGNDFDRFRSAFRDIASSEDQVRESDDYREINQFLLKEGWIKHLSGFSSADLSLLVALPKEADNFQPIGKEVVALLSNIQRSIGSAGYHLRRLIGRRPS
jgi:hypothetical protein